MQFKLCLWSSHHYIIPINTHIDRLHAQFPSGYRTKLRHWRTRLKLPSLRVWNLKLPALCIKIYIYISKYYLACLIWNTSQRTTRMWMPVHILALDRLNCHHMQGCKRFIPACDDGPICQQVICAWAQLANAGVANNRKGTVSLHVHVVPKGFFRHY